MDEPSPFVSQRIGGYKYTNFPNKLTTRELFMDAPFPPGMVEEIATFLKDDNKRPRGLDVYEEVYRSALFFPLQRMNEMAEMIQIARTIKPRIVMEIGADKGGSAYHWCKSLTTIKHFIGVEIRGCPYARLFEEAFQSVAFNWFEKSSYADPPFSVSCCPYLVRDCIGPYDLNNGRGIDVLFIDGDKGAFDRDFNTYLPLMSEGGIVFLHDVNSKARHRGDPRDTFDRIQGAGYRTQEILDTSEVEPAIARQELGIPPANPHEGWLRDWRGESCGVGVVFLDGRKDTI